MQSTLLLGARKQSRFTVRYSDYVFVQTVRSVSTLELRNSRASRKLEQSVYQRCRMDASASGAPAPSATKPALRKQAHPGPGAQPAHGIVWNEENLAENEKIKASLPHVKINEPKTPFHELLPDDDVDLEPLALDGEAPVDGNGTNGHATGEHLDDGHKRKFEDARKAHYNMKDLLAHKTSFEDDDDEDQPTANGR